MDRDDEPPAEPCSEDGVAGGDGVVRVDEVEATGSAQRERERRRGPGAPAGVRLRAARRDVADVVDLEAVARLHGRLGEQAAELAGGGATGRRNDTVEDEDADLDAGVPRGERLPMCPDPEHGIRGAGIELGDDGYAQRRCTNSVRWDSAAGR